MVFPYYPRPEDGDQESDEEQRREESRRRFNRARFEQIRRRYERMRQRQRQQLQDRTGTLTAEQLEYQHDSEGYRRPASAPVSRPSTRPTPTSSPHDYADRPASQSTGQASSSDSGGQSGTGSDKSEKTSTPQQQSVSQPSASGFPQDIEWQNDTNANDLAGFLHLAANLGEEYASGKAKTLQVINGVSPDEEDLDQAWKDLLQTTARIDLFEDEPWYTMRLGPAPSSGVSAFQSDYIDMAFAYGQGILQPGRRVGKGIPTEVADSETQAVDGTALTGEEAKERWYRGPDTELEPSIQHALANTFSRREWKDEWTKPEHLEGFLKGRLAPFLRKEYIDSLPWDDLTDFGKIHMYSSLMQTLHDETWHLNSPNSDWNIRLDDEAESAEVLLLAVTAVPLVNEARLIEEFGYASIAEARDDFLAQVQYAYEKFDIQPPEDLHEWSALELANELYDLLNNVYEPYYEGESSPENFQKAYEFIADPEFNDLYVFHPSVTISRLDGSHQTSPMELVFFVASFFIEPLDWAITIGDMINAAEDEDWGQAVLLGLTGLAPGALGRFVKRGSVSQVLKTDELLDADEWLDEAADAARVNSKVAASSGSNLIELADGRFMRPGYDATTSLKKQLEYVVEYDPSLAWKAHDLNSDVAQHAHHIVPKGMPQAARAREILAAKSISVDSHLNGIVLNEKVHYLTYGPQYAEAVNGAIESLQHAPREEIVMFLEDLARRLDELNAPDIDHSGIYQKNVMDWLETFKQT